MTLYSIKDWARHFEVRDTNRVDGPLKWLPVPTKTDGFGFSRIAAQKDGAQLLAAWYLILGVAAKQDRADRGKLMRNGWPLTAADLATITRFPPALFSRALAFFSDSAQGWLEKTDSEIPAAQMVLPTSDEDCAPSVRRADENAAPMRFSRPYRTGQDRTGQENRQIACAAGAAPTAAPSDSDWLTQIAASPAYQGIDVPREWAKATEWCAVKRKKLSRARFINWLNRAERPIAGSFRPSVTAQAIPEPQGWRAYLNHEYPDSRFSAGQPDEAHEWKDLDREIQQKLARELRNPPNP